MKILDLIRGLFKSRDKPQDSYRYSAAPFLFGQSASGKFVDEYSALRCSAVYGCVRILSESIAALPLHVYEYYEGGKRRAPQHSLYRLLHDSPNLEMTSFTYREVMMAHLLLHGNSYSQIMRNAQGEVIALYPLSPKRMTIERNDNGELIYEYMPNQSENEHMTKRAQITFRQKDILHIPALGFDGLIGYSPIAMARNAIGVSIACEEFGAKFFENDARPSGILKHPGTIKNPDKLRESWQRAFSGENHGKTAVLEEGVEYETISIPPDDAQFLDTRKFQIEEIARIFRVPLHMLGDLERATYSNITQQSLEFVMYTLTPWLTRLEQSFNKALFLGKERGRYFVKFSAEGFLRGDYESRMKGYQLGLQSGIFSINEIRELEDMNKIAEEEGGDLHLVNGNMAKLKDAGIAYSKKAGEKIED